MPYPYATAATQQVGGFASGDGMAVGCDGEPLKSSDLGSLQLFLLTSEMHEGLHVKLVIRSSDHNHCCRHQFKENS